MKYIRTDEGIYELDNSRKETSVCYLTTKGWVFKENVINQANTIEELCDVFMFKDTCANEWHIVNQNNGISMLGASLFSDTLKGYIETEKGLIPVAKMNKKGELELL